MSMAPEVTPVNPSTVRRKKTLQAERLAPIRSSICVTKTDGGRLIFVCSMRAGSGDITKVLAGRKVSTTQSAKRRHPSCPGGEFGPGGSGRKGKPFRTALRQAANVGRELFGRVWFSEKKALAALIRSRSFRRRDPRDDPLPTRNKEYEQTGQKAYKNEVKEDIPDGVDEIINIAL